MDTGKAQTFDSFHYMFIFFLFTQMVILSSLALDTVTQVLLYWSCNNFCFLLAVASYRRDMQMLIGVSYLGLVAQFLWGFDFIAHLLGFNLSSISDYVFKEGFTYANDVSVALHLIVPIAIIAFSFKIKPQWQSLAYAAVYSVCLYGATLFMTVPFDDVNCVYQGCSLGTFFSYQVYQWPLYAGFAVLLGYGVHYLTYYIYSVSLRFSSKRASLR